MKKFFVALGCVLSYVFPKRICLLIKSVFLYTYTGFYKNEFKSFGTGSVIIPNIRLLIGASNIIVGKNCILGKNIQLTAYEKYMTGQTFSPNIIIGDGVSIGDNSHITSIGTIIIGNNVLTGKNILISDNAHGSSSSIDVNGSPISRSLTSKGAIKIGDNVWIGEKASILGGVSIGSGSIIGANTVITKDVPDKTIAVGSPTRYIPII